MTNYYVDNAIGSSGNGLAWATAWKAFSNINYTTVQPGDTIYISGGSVSKTYITTLTVGRSGTAGNQVTITGGVDAGHNGTVIIDCEETRDNCIVMASKNYITISHLTMRNTRDCCITIKSATAGVIVEYCDANSGNPGAAINARGYDVRDCNGANCVIIRYNTWSTNASTTAQTDAMYSSNNNGVVFDGNTLICTNTDTTGHSDGFQSTVDINVVVKNNYIYQAGGADNHGMWIDDINSGGVVYIYNNIINRPLLADSYGIGYDFITAGKTGVLKVWNNVIYGALNGISFHGAAATTEIKNNIIVGRDGSVSGMHLDGSSITASNVDYNIIWSVSSRLKVWVGSTLSGTRSTTNKASPVLAYYEATTGPIYAGGNTAMGIGNATYSRTIFAGSDNNALGYYTNGRIYRNGGFTSTIQTYTVNQTIAIAVDFLHTKIWFKNLTTASNWNNSGTDNPATNTGGYSFSALAAGPWYAVQSLSSDGDSVTYNFGATSFVGTPPSGFSAWGSGTTLDPAATTNSAQVDMSPGEVTSVNKTWAQWQALGYDVHGLNVDPLFTDGPNADFTLTGSSPAINAGVTIATVATDKNGVSRPSGASYDIGPYEYVAATGQPFRKRWGGVTYAAGAGKGVW